MAVNGVEIEVGQVWATRAGRRVEIIGHDTSDKEYPWETRHNWYTDTGADEPGRSSLWDLMALVSSPLTSSANTDTPSVHGVQVLDMSVPGYETLANVLQMAYNQAAVGKGVERHAAVGEPFDKQVMQIGATKFGVGALLFQAFKKSEESQRLEHDRAVNELLGAIVYLAGAVIALEKKRGAAK